MDRLKYCNDYIMLKSSKPWEWCQTLFRWNLNLFCLRNGKPSWYKINSKIFGIPLPIIFPMEQPKKNSMVSAKINKKRLKFYKLGINCGILHLDYQKMRVKKVNIFQDINTEKLKFYWKYFFLFTKI